MPGFEAVALQLEIIARRRVGYELTQGFLDGVVRRWADTGISPKGIDIAIHSWKHPARKGSGRIAKRDRETQAELRERFRGLLRSGRLAIRVRRR